MAPVAGRAGVGRPAADGRPPYGPASGGDARYWAALAADTAHAFTLRLFADGRATGSGPSGTVHDRFRAWKEDLRDHEA